MESIYRLTEATWPLILLNLVMYFFLLFISMKKNKQPKGHIYFLLILLLVYCVFSFADSDWFHYYDIFKDEYKDLDVSSLEWDWLGLFEKNGFSSMETIYSYFGALSFGNYLLFRVYVWGAALLIMYSTLKRLNIDINRAYLYFIGAFFLLFCYARVSLAFSLAFLGMSFIVYPANKKILSIVLGIALIAASLLFHKTAAVIVVVVVLSFIPLNRISLLAIVAFLIPIYYLFNNILIFATFIDLDNSLALTHLQYELESAQVEDSGSIIRLFIVYYIRYVPFYLFVLWQIVEIIKGKFQNYPRYLQCFSSSAIYLVLISSLFLAIGQFVMFYRFINMSMIPIIILMSSEVVRPKNKVVLTVFLVGLFSSFFRLTYTLYVALL